MVLTTPARPVLERSSARETASRVALGEVAKQFLDQAFGIRTVPSRRGRITASQRMRTMFTTMMNTAD